MSGKGLKGVKGKVNGSGAKAGQNERKEDTEKETCKMLSIS